MKCKQQLRKKKMDTTPLPIASLASFLHIFLDCLVTSDSHHTHRVFNRASPRFNFFNHRKNTSCFCLLTYGETGCIFCGLKKLNPIYTYIVYLIKKNISNIFLKIYLIYFFFIFFLNFNLI